MSRGFRAAANGRIDCKELVVDRMVEQMTPMRDARAKLTKDPAQIEDIVQTGSRRASEVAKATLHEVNEAR